VTRDGRDREAFVAMLLGVLGGGRRLRDGIDAALAVAPSAVPRRLDARDYALLGLLGFHHRLEELVGQVAPELRSTSEAADDSRHTGAFFSGLLR
jgi:hypothetical protein